MQMTHDIFFSLSAKVEKKTVFVPKIASEETCSIELVCYCLQRMQFVIIHSTLQV